MPVTTRSQHKAEELEEEAMSSDSDSDVNLDSEMDSADDEPPSAMYEHPVDLLAFEELRNYTPIYSRSLLLQIRKQQQKILHESHLPYDRCAVKYLTWRAPDGQLTKIWEKGRYGQPYLGQKDRVEVAFMNRVALDRDFQRYYGRHVHTTSLLRIYGDAITTSYGTKKMYFDAPYAFCTIQTRKKHEYKDAEQMQRYRDAATKSLEFWKKSVLRRKLTQTIKDIAVASVPIKKIVCFGLGDLESARAYDSMFQHMPIFSIAKNLARTYKKLGIQQQKIQIVLQEPEYEEKDWTLFNELHEAMGCIASGDIEFTDDPDGLLAIGSSTMVIAPHLPVDFPWIQIIADLFAAGSGPAVIIGDHIAVDPEKQIYTVQDRPSPAVARLLSDRYFQFQRAREAGKHAVHLPVGMTGYNPWGIDWFPEMDIYVRRTDDAESANR